MKIVEVLIYLIYVCPLILFLYLLKQWIKGGKCKVNRDMKDQFVIITGASSGLGKQTAYDLISKGAKVVYACRNTQNAEQAIKELPEQCQANASFIPLDLCSFTSIKSFAETINQSYPLINILINNAGAQPANFNLTEDKLESSVQGNHLGPMLLTLLLLNHFNQSDARIINVTSLSHYFSDLNDNSIDNVLSNADKVKEHYFKSNSTLFKLYATTKLMNIYFTHFLADKLQCNHKHIKAVCLHPGVVDTAFLKFIHESKVWGPLFRLATPLWRYLSKTIVEGAQTHLHLSYLPHEKLRNGAYYADCFVNRISTKAQNPFLRDNVIDWSLKVLESAVGSSCISLRNETIY